MPSWIHLDTEYQTYSEIHVVSAPAIPDGGRTSMKTTSVTTMQDVMFSKRHDLSLKNGREHQTEMVVSYYLQNKCEILCHHI